MKFTAASSIGQLLVLLAGPASGLLSGMPQAPEAKEEAVPRTDSSFDAVDQNKDGVISRPEFVKSNAPGPSPATPTAAAPWAAPEPDMPPPLADTAPEADENRAPADHLSWPRGVEPGTNDTTKNVKLDPKTHEVTSVWHTKNVSAWKEGNMTPGDPMDKENARVARAVGEALTPPPPPKVDGPATAAAKNTVNLGGKGDSVVAAAAGGPNMSLPSVTLTFELKNINYYMLDEPVTRSPAIGHHNVPQASHFSLAQARGPINHRPPTLEEAHLHEKTNGEALQKAVKDTIDQLLAIAFGQVSSIVMADEAPRERHTEIGHKTLVLSAQALPPSAPAPAPPGPLLASWSLSPAPMPSTAVEEPEPVWSLPQISVTMLPGRSLDADGNVEGSNSDAIHGHGQKRHAVEEYVVKPPPPPPSATLEGATAVESTLFAGRAQRHHLRGEARAVQLLNQRQGHHAEAMTTIVKVELVESDEHPAHSIADTRKALSMYIMDDTLSSALAAAIDLAVDMQPLVGIIEEATGVVTPYNVSACASHIHKLVGDFSRAYTRRQVVPALYSACRHYGQKVSFSHDVIIDKDDHQKCKTATTRFARLWQYGKGKVDYGRFCLQLCELRHGQDSIQCDAYKHFNHKISR